MSAPSFVSDKPSPLLDSPICDNSSIESEILRDLCEKTLSEYDVLLTSLRSCITASRAALSAPPIWVSASELLSPISEEIWAVVVSDSESDLALSDSAFHATAVAEFDAALSDAALSVSEFDETMVHETNLGVWLLDSIEEKATEAFGGGDGAAAAERVSETAVDPASGVTSPVTPRGEDMIRILLPRFFNLVRSSLSPF